MRVYTPSDWTSLSLRDGHRYSVTAKANRYAAPGYGSPNRTLGMFDVTCEACIADCLEPRHSMSTDPEKTPLTMAESDWIAGKNQKSKTTLEALRAQLDELMADSE
jgi:hypothetical protein